jgi:DNA-binding CsgD family transcriptional regulator
LLPRLAASQVVRLDALTSLVTGPLVAAHAFHARGVATRSVATLQRALELYDETGAAVHAAETAAELADQYQRDGNTRAATAARQRMTGILQRCGGARTPRLITAAGGEPLTEREREVALMAAGGLTSKEIAGRLFLSSRTVETHLDRIYRKLGVAGRDELRQRLSA